MSADETSREIALQLELIRDTVHEIAAARTENTPDRLHAFELAGFGALLMNLYNGAENVFKRIAKSEGLAVPSGALWHAELFNAICRPLPSTSEPFLRPAEAEVLRDYRNFRHVMVHGYGVRLKWGLMEELVVSVEDAYRILCDATARYESRARDG